MNFIVYKTTNLLTKKYYIGVHKQTSIDFDGYLGSGIHLKNSIKKYGKENFYRETLFSFTDKDDAYIKEVEIVNEEFINDNETYNMKEGGFGGSEPGRKLTKEHKRNIGIANTGKIRSEEFKKENSSRQKGEKNHFYGKKHTEESIKKMKEKRNQQVFSEETREKMSISAKNRPAFFKGKKHSEESRKKMSLAHIGIKRGPQKKVTCPHCNKEGGVGAMKLWHFDNCKNIKNREISV